MCNTHTHACSWEIWNHYWHRCGALGRYNFLHSLKLSSLPGKQRSHKWKVLVFLGRAPVNYMVKVLKLRRGGMRGTCRHVCGKTSMLSPWEHAVSPRCGIPAYLCRPVMKRDKEKSRVNNDCAIQSHFISLFTLAHETSCVNLFWIQLLYQRDKIVLPIRDGAD